MPRLLVALVLAGLLLAPGRAGAELCTFTFGFADLKAQLGDWMGDPMSCEFADPDGSGDMHQQTTAGLAFWRKATNVPTFTDGWQHWALSPAGLVTWYGDSIDPTPDAVPGEPHPCTQSGTCRRVRPIDVLPVESPPDPLPAVPTAPHSDPRWTRLAVAGWSPVSGFVSPSYPADPRFFRLGAGRQVQTSADHGQTWTALSPTVCGATLQFAPDFPLGGLVAAFDGPELCGVSRDGGLGWDRLNANTVFDQLYLAPDVESLVVSPTFGLDQRLYYGAGFNASPRPSALFTSPDAGRTWSALPLPVPGVRLQGPGGLAATGSAVGPTTLLARLTDVLPNPGVRYFRSPNGGRTWEEVTERLRHPATGQVPLLELTAGRDPARVYAAPGRHGVGGGVWASADAGQTWQRVSDQRQVAATPDGCAVAAQPALELLCEGRVVVRTAPPSGSGRAVMGLLAVGGYPATGQVLVSTLDELYLVDLRPA